MQTNKIGRTYC